MPPTVHRDDSRSPSTTAPAKRWVPPSSLRRDALSPDEQNDLVFRKVRGHLNKLTPEKFEKLSEDILGVGLNSPKTLSGVIFLIFDKALDEPKYSSMYARLCKLLSERAPNFEGPNASCNTYERLLLTQCEVEFRNRAKATEKATYRKHGPLTPDEEELRQIAKRKMLGNIKFIGELGKLEMVKEPILHMCIETLLRKKKPSPVNEANKGKRAQDNGDNQVEVLSAEDLECLCQIMRTCGRLLDTDAAKGYFDQYFERIEQLANNEVLPARIRFLLQDVIELRLNKWVPRKVAVERGPRTIQEIRQEALRNNGIIITNDRRGLGPVGRGVLGPVSGAIFGNLGGYLSRNPKSGLDDVFGSLPPGTLDLGTGPGVINADFSFNENGFGSGRPKTNNYSGPSSGSGYAGNRDGSQNYNEKGRGRAFNSSTSFGSAGGSNPQTNGSYGGGSGSKQLPPRFQRKIAQQGQSDSNYDSYGSSTSADTDDFSLRPQADSMMLKPKIPGFMPKFGTSVRPGVSASPPPASVSLAPQGVAKDVPLPPNQLPMVPLKSGPIEIKPVAKPGKKDKGLSKGAVLSKLATVLDDLADLNVAQDAYVDMNVPEKYGADVAAKIMDRLISSEGEECGTVKDFLIKLGTSGHLTTNMLLEGLKMVMMDFDGKGAGGDEKIADAIASMITADLVSFASALDLLEGGIGWPVSLKVLGRLRDEKSEAWLKEAYEKSKFPLVNVLPVESKSKERLAVVLDEANLAFLMPLLQVQRQLVAALERDPSPTAFYRYIKECMDNAHFAEPAFVFALVSVVMKHIISESGQGTRGGGADADNESNEKAKEKDLLGKFAPVLKAFLHDQSRLQVTAIYATQSVCHALEFPKGMLLRWFVLLYDLEIVEEEAFIRWKEDINDEHQGKGKALFQVNQWLTWLQEAESEDGEDEDDEDANS